MIAIRNPIHCDKLSLSDLNMIRSGIPLLEIVISGSTCRLNIYFQSQTRLDVLVYPAECCALVDI